MNGDSAPFESSQSERVKKSTSDLQNRDLAMLYMAELVDIDTTILHRPADKATKKGLSGLFLPSVPLDIGLAKRKIMIVGCETRDWNVLAEGQEFASLEDYIDRAMQKHRDFFAYVLGAGSSKGRAFHNFTRKLGDKFGPEGLIYSNLFCFSWNGGSPVDSGHMGMIEVYSKRLLKVQIEFFKPDIIIFANGVATARQRRSFFPIPRDEMGKAIGKDYAKSDGIPNRQLWEYSLPDNTRCFRIHHPSSLSKGAPAARDFLIRLLKTE